MYRSVVRTCNDTNRYALARAKKGLESTTESVVSSLVKFGNLDEALHVFHRLPQRTVLSWTAVICGYTKAGQCQEALGMYQRMREEGVHPNKFTLVSLLKACGSTTNLKQGKLIHADAVQYGCGSDLFVGTCLINMYAKCGSTMDAQAVFDGLPQRDVVSWTAMVAGYVQQGHSEKALQLYQQMHEEGVNADARIFVMVLQACGCIAEKEGVVLGDGHCLRVHCLQQGLVIYAEARRKGYDSDVFVGSTLISMYTKCGAITFAEEVFGRLSQKNLVSWNAMLACYALQVDTDNVWQLYQQMKEELVSLDGRTFVSMLQACGSLAEKDTAVLIDGQSIRMESFRKGKVVHAEAQRSGCDSDVFVGSALVSMYAKCGSIIDAQYVFSSLSNRNVVLWNALLAGYAQQGQGERALNLYDQMREELVSPDDRTFVSVLQACASCAGNESIVPLDWQSPRVKFLHEGKVIHADTWRKGYDSDTFVGNSLVTMYAKCGSILDAQSVFDGLLQRDVVSWNAMLTGYIKEGQGKKALQLYNQMRAQSVSPDARTLVTVLQACASLPEGEDLSVAEERQFCKFQTLLFVQKIHAEAQQRHYDSEAFLANSLVSMYAKCGSIVEAQSLFDGLSQRDVVSWNAMLVGYAQHGKEEKAIELYHLMRGDVVSPDEWTFVHMLHVCGSLAGKEETVLLDGQVLRVHSLQKGKAIHNEAHKRGYGSDVLVCSNLISMYAKCGSIVDAQNVFDELSQQNEVLWTVILLAYSQQGQWDKVLQLYHEMQEEGVSPNLRTFVCVLQACANLVEKEDIVLVDGQLLRVESLKRGKAIHAEVQNSGYESDVFVDNTLISMYGKCGSIVDAEHVFDRLLQRDIVSWSAIFTAYIQQGQGEKALQLYPEMLEAGMTSDDRIFVSMLQLCGNLAAKEEIVVIDGESLKVEALQKGRAIDAEARRAGYESNVFVSNTLVSMYAKCGSLMDARNVFDRLSEKTVVTWNAMLAGYAEQGQGVKALKLYDLMQQEVVNPDNWTFVSALQACGSIAETEEVSLIDGQLLRLESLKKGKALHHDACTRGCETDLFVCSALVSMYGKCGSILDAKLVFDTLSQRSVEWWNAMLGAYVQQGEWDRALHLYGQMLEEGTSPDETTYARILRLCGNTGALDICMQIHRNLVSTGNDLDPFVAPSLISAYAKCSSVVDAQDVFDALPQPDVASWNALTAGYARQGEFETSLQCYDKMQLTGVKPNEVTFLTLLSACSHAGMLTKGVEYFESMSRDHGLAPEMDHYVTMVDLLGRAGCFSRVEHLLSTMPMQPNLAMWLSLLGSCRKHGNVLLGKQAFEKAIHLQPKSAAPYIVMRNIYAHAGMWDCAKEVDGMKLRAGAWKKPGRSWIEHEQEVHAFIVGEGNKHRQQEQIHDLSGKLTVNIELKLHSRPH